jgi:hypothetical protein
MRLYNNEALRESQWYVPSTKGMTQTSVRFDSKTYSIDEQKEVDASTIVGR